MVLSGSRKALVDEVEVLSGGAKQTMHHKTNNQEWGKAKLNRKLFPFIFISLDLLSCGSRN